MSEQPAQTPEQPAERKPTFDQVACAILRQAHSMIYERCPEVRSIASTLDYHGALNDATIQKGAWTSAQGGPVEAADAIFGSMFQTLRLMEDQFSRAIELGAALRDDVQAVSQENVRLRGLNEQLGQEIEKRAAQLGIGEVEDGFKERDGVPADSPGG